MKIIVVVLLGMLCPSVLLATTAEDIVSQLSQREESIKSIHGKFNVLIQVRMNNGSVVEVKKQYEWSKKGGIQKLIPEYNSTPESFKQNNSNSTSRMMTEKEIRTFDGQVTKLFLPERKMGSIILGEKNFFVGKVPADWLLMQFQKKPLSAFLKQEGMSLKYAGEVELEGQTCHLLEFTKLEMNGKVYLTDKQGLVPIKFEDYITNPKLPNTRGEHIFSEFKRYGDITMPTKVVVNVYNVYTDKEELAMKEVFTVEELDVNGPISDTDLLIQFPTGTRVYDAVSDTSYIVH